MSVLYLHGRQRATEEAFMNVRVSFKFPFSADTPNMKAKSTIQLVNHLLNHFLNRQNAKPICSRKHGGEQPTTKEALSLD